ncbi:hypothetical protein HME9302_02451 [Alteripontixanthobacter maritimus]|uniref:DUF2141 domain-containing protein n=1 Tax=Alteripontixanthobacter maritimus TaxID=2161824 RepID=A0A369Q8L8_9SPHN|nr:DUF2141 domain-containing protein [Alteripontixanthobacter maritimus]RDC61231.1 hypothetical protein HME9302_02451 [Alteripontixanthobacter maritimus]
MTKHIIMGLAAAGLIAGSIGMAVPAHAQYKRTISNNLSDCNAGSSSAVMVTVDGIDQSSGTMRVQIYRGTEGEWLKKGKWLSRIETRAKNGSMTFCLPVSGPGTYAVAVRHDKNGNGKTDLTTDGGAMSNNPSLNILNLGKPSYKKTAFSVGTGVKSIRIRMRYM